MAVSLAQTATKTIDNDAGTTSTSGSLTFSAGGFAILGIIQYRAAGARTITSVQLDGTTNFTLDKELAQGSDGAAKAHIYSLPNVSAGAHTVTVTWTTGGPERVTLFFHEVSGVSAVSPADGAGASATAGSGNAASGNFTTLGDSFIYGLASFDTSLNPATVAADTGGGWALTDATNGVEKNGAVNIVAGSEYKQNPGTTTHNAQFSNTSTEWVSLGFAYKAKLVYTMPATATNYAITGIAPILEHGKVGVASGPAGISAFSVGSTALDFVGSSAAGVYVLAADGGVYLITGTAATLRATRILTAATTSYLITGTAAGLKRGLKLPSDAGSYLITGTAASLLWKHMLPSNAGSFLITGTAATLKRGLKFAADPGAWLITGTAAGLKRGLKVPANAGSYLITGTNAGLLVAHRLIPDSVVFNITGTAAGLKRGLKLPIGIGAFLINGTDATFIEGGGGVVNYTLDAASGLWVITGTNIRGIWSFPTAPSSGGGGFPQIIND